MAKKVSNKKKVVKPKKKSMKRNTKSSGSAYFLVDDGDELLERHTLAVLVDNQPGVLARVIGLFSGRGYNIESLTVCETEHEKRLSRITIVAVGTARVLEQIKHQIERMVPVHRVVDLSLRAHELGYEKPLERELALIKVRAKGEKRMESLRLAEAYDAKVADASLDHFVFEMTGRSNKVEQFAQLMSGLGLVEICRTGTAAMNRGHNAMEEGGMEESGMEEGKSS